MKKALLAILIAGACIFVVGCGESATPAPTPESKTEASAVPETSPETTQPTPTPTPASEEKTGAITSDAIGEEVFQSVLEEDAGLDVVSLEIADGRPNGGEKAVVLGYQSTAIDEQELATETGFILGAYLGSVNEGWDVDSLMVVIGDVNEQTIGTWYCTKEWTDQFLAGEMDQDEISLRALQTMESE